jgi:sugar lactone lactonase YvrE
MSGSATGREPCHHLRVTDFALPGRAVFPEGITEGPGTTFYVGSLGDGTIYRGDTATGEVTIAIPPDSDGRQAIAGLAIDGHSRLIACDFDGGQIFVYDLRSGSLVARRAFPAAESSPNDVVVVGDDAYITDSAHPLVWRVALCEQAIGEPEPAIDLTPFGPADPAYLNGIVAHRDGTMLLVASQGEGGTLWRVDLTQNTAMPVDLGGYDFNADGMLVFDGVLYGVTNRGESRADVRFMISGARLEPDWRSGTLIGELADPEWDFPTTIAHVGGQMLVVCSQVGKKDTDVPPSLPFRVVSAGFPDWS